MHKPAFDPTLADSSFSSTLMGMPVPALPSSSMTAAPRGGWVTQVLRVFGKGAARKTDASLVHTSSGLYSERGLLELGARMLAECHRAKAPLALVVLSFRELEDMRKGYQAHVARKAAQIIARRCRTLAGVNGLAARTGPAEFSLLLPGKTVHEALAAVRADLGKYPFIACEIRNESIDLMASVRAAVVAGSESVAPALAMVRGMPPLTVLLTEPAAQVAPRKAPVLEDREFPAMQFPATMPAPLIA